MQGFAACGDVLVADLPLQQASYLSLGWTVGGLVVLQLVILALHPAECVLVGIMSRQKHPCCVYPAFYGVWLSRPPVFASHLRRVCPSALA